MAIGVALGLGGGAVASRAMTSLLFGLNPLDPATFAGVSVFLVVVALVAVWVARTDPAVALRLDEAEGCAGVRYQPRTALRRLGTGCVDLPWSCSRP